MKSTRIDAAVRELSAEETEIARRVDSLRGELKTAEASLTYVRKAIATLTDKPSSQPQTKRQTASREEVVAAISECLRNGEMSESDLKQQVEQQVASPGKSRTGLTMRFQNALKDERFL